MNIGFEAKRFFTNYTGLGNYSRFVVDALSEHNTEHQYYLFTPRGAANNEVSAILNRPNVKVIKPGGLYRAAPSVWRTWGVSLNPYARTLDIFHGLSQELPFNLPHKIKKVVTVHDLIFYRFPQFYHAADLAIYKAKVKSACRRADKIIAISKQTEQDLIDFLNIHPSKIEVVYQGCHPNFNRVITQQEIAEVKKRYSLPEQFILNVGTIEERKNLLVLIEAFALLPKDMRIPLVVIGRVTDYYQRVILRAKELGVLDEIIFLTDASFSDFPAFYKGSTVFVYPSLFEGFGIPLVEAITSGTPVITSQGSCFQEAAGADAVYIDPKNPRELASRLRDILGDSKLRSRMVEKSALYIRKFEPAEISSALIRLYNSL
jgi:glycosyltransferase involved in cell wall biosynthesis